MDDNTNNLLVSVSHVSSAGLPSGLEGSDDASHGRLAHEGGEEPMVETSAKDGACLPEDVRVLIRDLVLRFGITREQLETIYEECEEMKAVELMEKEHQRQQLEEEEAERQRERVAGEGPLHLQVVGEATLVPSTSSVSEGSLSDGSQTEYQGQQTCYIVGGARLII